MTNFYYYNENGDKISVTGKHLKLLAENGHITPETIIENENGKQALAGKVKGLTFAETLPDWTYEPALPIASVPVPPVEANPFTAPVPIERNPFTVAVPAIKPDSFTTAEIRQALRDADRRATEHQALVRQAILMNEQHTYESGQQKKDTTVTGKQEEGCLASSGGLIGIGIIWIIINAWRGKWEYVYSISAIVAIVVLIAVIVDAIRHSAGRTAKQLMTAKQRCGTLGGIFLAIGILLFFIGYNMYSHNMGLIDDHYYAKRNADNANRAMSYPENRVNTETMRSAMKEGYDAAQEVVKASRNLRQSSYSPLLINLLRGLGILLFLTGFVLTVVGWCIPNQNRP